MAGGIPIFGLDALSSAGYGPEAALTILLPLGVMGLAYIQPLSAAIIVLLAIVYFSYRQIVNLRGVREPGVLFMIPTYLFVVCLLSVIGRVVYETCITGGHPRSVIAPPLLPPAQHAVSVWLLLKAFASGCTAITGVEAVSNGVQTFREPVVSTARRTLSVIVTILIMLLAGIAYLSRCYQIGATPPGQPGYQSVLSQLTAAVGGKSVFYSVTIGSILSVLSLSANTSFAAFPRLCRAVAVDGYLPRSFANRGRRLVYSEGIWISCSVDGPSGALRRCHGPPHSAVCRRRIPGIHALASRYGGALEKSGRQGRKEQYAYQRPWRSCYRHHCARGARR
jgi:amino acid transporter